MGHETCSHRTQQHASERAAAAGPNDYEGGVLRRVSERRTRVVHRHLDVDSQTRVTCSHPLDAFANPQLPLPQQWEALKQPRGVGTGDGHGRIRPAFMARAASSAASRASSSAASSASGATTSPLT